MTLTTKLYYIAGALAALAAAGYVIKDGFVPDEYLAVGLLAVVAIVMLTLGHRDRHKSVD